MKSVVLRKDTDYTIAFFTELRKMVFVNEDGSKILDLFFNLEKTPDEISKETDLEEPKVIEFLGDVKKSLAEEQLSYPVPSKGYFDAPLSAELQISNTCNLRCKHCFQADYSKVLTYKEVDKRLSVLSKNGIFMLNLVGGELFLHKDAIKIIKRACDYYGFATNIVTNATLIDEEKVRQLKSIQNKPAFLISLEGTEQFNDEIRGAGVFKKVKKVIAGLRKAGFCVEISCTLSNFNYPNFQELIQFSNKYGAPCNFNLFKPFKKEHGKLVIEPNKYFKFIDQISVLQKKGTKAGVTNAAIEGYLKGVKRDVCRAGVSGITIDVGGLMLPCALLYEASYYKKTDLPIFGENFIREWQSSKVFAEFRKNDLTECQACAYLFSGELSGRDPYGLAAFIERRSH